MSNASRDPSNRHSFLSAPPSSAPPSSAPPRHRRGLAALPAALAFVMAPLGGIALADEPAAPATPPPEAVPAAEAPPAAAATPPVVAEATPGTAPASPSGPSSATPPPAATATVVAPPPGPAPAPPPPPYSLPWQLRPAGVANVVRSDTAIAFYENAAGNSGSTVATMLLASYKVTPSLAPLIRIGLSQNSPPEAPTGMTTPAGGQSFINPIVGLTYARPVGPLRMAGFLGATIPIGMGSNAMTDPGASTANSAGIAARSGMDNAMFAVNYFTVIAGLDVAYVAHGFTAQLEATFFQLTRVRTSSGDDSRTNSTAGLHLGYFIVPQLSLGGELRYQRWLSDAAPVKTNAAARETVSMAIGPRAHFKIGKNWLRPGIAYARGLDKPLTTSSYNMVQIDLPFAF